MNVRVSLEVAAGPLAAAEARRAIEGLRAYIQPHAYDDIRLLVSELVTNAARHAGLRPGERILIIVRATPSAITTEVIDNGTGFDERTVVVSDGSGWGLRLVAKLADRWGVRRENGTTAVWFEIEGAAATRERRRLEDAH